MADDVGVRFAQALGAKDFERVRSLLHPEVDFVGLTPRRTWTAGDPDAVVEEVLRSWFEESDELEEVLSVESEAVADRTRVGYRFRGRNPDGPFVVE